MPLANGLRTALEPKATDTHTHIPSTKIGRCQICDTETDPHTDTHTQTDRQVKPVTAVTASATNYYAHTHTHAFFLFLTKEFLAQVTAGRIPAGTGAPPGNARAPPVGSKPGSRAPPVARHLLGCGL